MGFHLSVFVQKSLEFSQNPAFDSLEFVQSVYERLENLSFIKRPTSKMNFGYFIGKIHEFTTGWTVLEWFTSPLGRNSCASRLFLTFSQLDQGLMRALRMMQSHHNLRESQAPALLNFASAQWRIFQMILLQKGCLMIVLAILFKILPYALPRNGLTPVSRAAQMPFLPRWPSPEDRPRLVGRRKVVYIYSVA